MLDENGAPPRLRGLCRALSVGVLTACALSVSGGVAFADTLDVDPRAPAWVHGAANTVLYLHIGGGVLGLISGAAALVFRKGARLHRMAGNVFFASMLTMSGIAAPVAVLMADRLNVLAALFTLYLLATDWMTVRRREGVISGFEMGAFCAALGLSAAAWTLGLLAMNSPTGTLDDAPAPAFFIFGTMAPLAAASDLNMILRRGLSGAPRIARHLWRMCFALFIASGSLFLGQAQVFPEFVRGSPILFVLALAPLAFLLFWLVRVRFTKAFGSIAAARGNARLKIAASGALGQ